jgi:branched-chain amino acid transport system permease protein
MKLVSRAWIWVVLALALAFPFISFGDRTQFVQQIAVFVLSSATLALSWDVLARTGQLSLAHAAFYGLGAYSFGLLATAGVPQMLAFLFGIATLAFTEVVKTIVNQLNFTGGPQGYLVPALLDGNFVPLYYLGLGVLVLLILISSFILRSKLGFAFTAIRQGELVARVLGVDVTRYKLLAFVISSFFVGLTGAFVAGKTFYITPPSAFDTGVSVVALVMPIFGGLYSSAGPVLAAVILRVLEEVLKLLAPSAYLIAYGAILVFSILYLPRGILGLLARFKGRS